MDFHEYFRTKSLTKTPRVGVHYEQKITPDLLWCVAHVVLDLTKENPDRIFTDNDVRESPVFNSLMQDYFSKAHCVYRYQLYLAFPGNIPAPLPQ